MFATVSVTAEVLLGFATVLRVNWDCCHCRGAAGVATVSVTAVVLLVFTNAVSVVTTFLCTRRRYRQKSNNARPLSPEEKGAYYEAVEIDSVQMQSSPAFTSVAERECDYV